MTKEQDSMPQEHPIIPPPELIHEWQIKMEYTATRAAREALVATVFQLGADQELDACCEILCDELLGRVAEELRAARRPKPPSLKEQALDSWDRLRNEVWCEEIDFDLDFIRRALEQLDD